jgi:O-antigen/teichoic acid export membrane protein
MRLQNSIIRRSLPVTLFFVLGHGFHYLLLAAANWTLPQEAFGLFYTSISLINVLLTPGIVLTFLFAQRFASLAAGSGDRAVREELHRILEWSARWGGAATVGAVLILVVFGAAIGVQSFAVVLLAPIVSFASFLFETARSALQGMMRFAWFSAAWVLCRAFQCLLGFAAFYFVGTVWSGLAGIAVATLVALIVVRLPLRAGTAVRPWTEAELIKLNEIAPFIAGYGLFTIMANADMLIAYLVLNRDQLGVYAASSVLPKAVVTATLPLAQVVLPVIVSKTVAAAGTRFSVLKGTAGALGLGVVGWLVLTVGSGLVCSSRFGLQFCDNTLLYTLALAAIPLGALRVLIVAGLAKGYNWQPLLQLFAVAALFAVALVLPSRPLVLADLYLVVAWALFVLYVLVLSISLLRSQAVFLAAGRKRLWG